MRQVERFEKDGSSYDLTRFNSLTDYQACLSASGKYIPASSSISLLPGEGGGSLNVLEDVVECKGSDPEC